MSHTHVYTHLHTQVCIRDPTRIVRVENGKERTQQQNTSISSLNKNTKKDYIKESKSKASLVFDFRPSLLDEVPDLVLFYIVH